MADYPALPLWTDAYMADTRHLTCQENGAYLLLLMKAWPTGFPPTEEELSELGIPQEHAWRHVDWSLHPSRLLGARWRVIRNAVIANHRGGCVYCGRTKPLEVDHIIPRAAGGTHDWDNLQVLCRPCNASKGAKV